MHEWTDDEGIIRRTRFVWFPVSLSQWNISRAGELRMRYPYKPKTAWFTTITEIYFGAGWRAYDPCNMDEISANLS